MLGKKIVSTEACEIRNDSTNSAAVLSRRRKHTSLRHGLDQDEEITPSLMHNTAGPALLWQCVSESARGD